MVRYHIFTVSSTPKIIKYNCSYINASHWIKLLKQRYLDHNFQMILASVLDKLLGFDKHA
jgi:hypothetical protein